MIRLIRKYSALPGLFAVCIFPLIGNPITLRFAPRPGELYRGDVDIVVAVEDERFIIETEVAMALKSRGEEGLVIAETIESLRITQGDKVVVNSRSLPLLPRLDKLYGSEVEPHLMAIIIDHLTSQPFDVLYDEKRNVIKPPDFFAENHQSELQKKLDALSRHMEYPEDAPSFEKIQTALQEIVTQIAKEQNYHGIYPEKEVSQGDSWFFSARNSHEENAFWLEGFTTFEAIEEEVVRLTQTGRVLPDEESEFHRGRFDSNIVLERESGLPIAYAMELEIEIASRWEPEVMTMWILYRDRDRAAPINLRGRLLLLNKDIDKEIESINLSFANRESQRETDYWNFHPFGLPPSFLHNRDNSESNAYLRSLLNQEYEFSIDSFKKNFVFALRAGEGFRDRDIWLYLGYDQWFLPENALLRITTPLTLKTEEGEQSLVPTTSIFELTPWDIFEFGDLFFPLRTLFDFRSPPDFSPLMLQGSVLTGDLSVMVPANKVSLPITQEKRSENGIETEILERRGALTLVRVAGDNIWSAEFDNGFPFLYLPYDYYTEREILGDWDWTDFVFVLANVDPGAPLNVSLIADFEEYPLSLEIPHTSEPSQRYFPQGFEAGYDDVKASSVNEQIAIMDIIEIPSYYNEDIFVFEYEISLPDAANTFLAEPIIPEEMKEEIRIEFIPERNKMLVKYITKERIEAEFLFRYPIAFETKSHTLDNLPSDMTYEEEILRITLPKEGETAPLLTFWRYIYYLVGRDGYPFSGRRSGRYIFDRSLYNADGEKLLPHLHLNRERTTVTVDHIEPIVRIEMETPVEWIDIPILLSIPEEAG